MQITRADLAYYFLVHRILFRPLIYFLYMVLYVYFVWYFMEYNIRHPNQQAVLLAALSYAIVPAAQSMSMAFGFIIAIALLRVLLASRNGIVLQPLTVRVDEATLAVKSPDTETKIAWKQFSRVSAGKRLVLVKFKGLFGQSIVLPRRQVPDAAIEMMKAGVEKAKNGNG